VIAAASDREWSVDGTGIIEAIKGRRSNGAVRSEQPPRELIAAMLEAAVWAPNHRLTEPWRFFVVAGVARRAFGEAMAAGKATTTGEPAGGTATAQAVAKAMRAPVIVAVAVEPQIGPKVIEIEEVAAGAAAVQNMLLAARALGLAAIWRTGAPAYDPIVKAFFGLSPEAHLVGFVYVGYPAELSGEVGVRTRRPAAEVTRWLGWE
jgi:nitroreductase